LYIDTERGALSGFSTALDIEVVKQVKALCPNVQKVGQRTICCGKKKTVLDLTTVAMTNPPDWLNPLYFTLDPRQFESVKSYHQLA
jgi:hypothetical protein